MINNQLKNIKKKWVFNRRNNTFEKENGSTEFCQVTGQLGFAGFFLIPIFWLTRTSLPIKLIGSRFNPSDRSRFINYELDLSIDSHLIY